MNTISSDELRARIDRHEPIILVMALGSWAYNLMHIPGSVGVEALPDLIAKHEYDKEVIVYDTNPACPASYRTYYRLESLGFSHVRYFAGGVEAWARAGYPVEGSLAGHLQQATETR